MSLFKLHTFIEKNQRCNASKKFDTEFAVLSFEIFLCSSGDNQENVTEAAVLSSDKSTSLKSDVDVIIQGIKF